MKRPELSIVIPFYNDSGCPIPFVKGLKRELKDIDYEIILVDDFSKDSTPKELDSLKEKRIKIIYNEKNKDYGGAIMTGLNNAKGKIIGFTCGDGEVNVQDIVRVYGEMGDSEVIKAIRKRRKDGIGRDVISKIFNVWSKLRFKSNIKDINGYPVYFKREIYNDLKDLQTGWLFNLDLLRKIENKDYKIKGIRVEHHERSEGISKMTPKRIMWMVWKFLKYN